MTDIFFEDLRPGDVTTFGDMPVSREAIVAFAREFDPQPFHVDEEAARDTFVGRLIASGWHTAALQMRMFYDAWLGRAASQGAPGSRRWNGSAPSCRATA
jgi:acyl dehydratase